MRASRWIVAALVVGSLALSAVSYAYPWWRFTLFAPQYPHGLTLTVALTGVGGDVHEVDMLNHYIGMGHLETAAAFERAHALWGVVFVAAAVVALAFVDARWLWLPQLLFVIGFLGDSWYWLHRFGHHLNAHAPLHIAPFTPHLFGPGTIGQFHTTAVPALGFYLSFGALVMLSAASIVRRRS